MLSPHKRYVVIGLALRWLFKLACVDEGCCVSVGSVSPATFSPVSHSESDNSSSEVIGDTLYRQKLATSDSDDPDDSVVDDLLSSAS